MYLGGGYEDLRQRDLLRRSREAQLASQLRALRRAARRAERAQRRMARALSELTRAQGVLDADTRRPRASVR